MDSHNNEAQLFFFLSFFSRIITIIISFLLYRQATYENRCIVESRLGFVFVWVPIDLSHVDFGFTFSFSLNASHIVVVYTRG